MSLLSALSTTLDRVMALGKPLVYRKLYHRKHQVFAVIACFILSFSINFFDIFRQELDVVDDHYVIIFNEEYMSRLLPTSSAYLREIVRFILVVSIIISNIILVNLYKAKNKKAAQLSDSTQKELLQKQNERTLVNLTSIQSATICLAILPAWGYYIFSYAAPDMAGCSIGAVVGNFCDMAFEFLSILEFFLMFIFNKQFRKNAKKSIQSIKSKIIGSTNVQPFVP